MIRGFIMDCTRVEFKDLNGVDSFVVETLDDNGCLFYTIIINSQLSVSQQQAAYYHELNHILKNDFERAKLTSVTEVELQAHGV